MKTILVASDSFKGTLSSKDIINIVNDTVKQYFPHDFIVKSALIADRGEGTIDAFSSFKDGEVIYVNTYDAENNLIEAPLFISKDGYALIEVASVIGLPNIKNTINPLDRTTKGIGVLIKKAISLGINKIYIALGGTSTNDLGIGMLQELGISFNNGDIYTMSNIEEIKSIDTSNYLLKDKDIEFILLVDITNPLLSNNGATYTFGKQKGYGPYLDLLEDKMTKLTKIFEKETNKKLNNIPSLGAAGGLAGALYAFSNATIVSGIEEILKLSNFDQKIKDVDYIITGEGSFDNQSLNGKAISGIIEHVNKDKLIIICGQNKLKDSEYTIYETSNNKSNFEDIKKYAKENYQKELIKVLNNIKD